MEKQIYDKKSNKYRTIRSISKDIFEVESKTKTGEFWKCNLSDRTCECPGYKFWAKKSGGVCNHLEFLIQNIAELTKPLTVKNDDVLEYFNGRTWIPYEEIEKKFGEDIITKLIMEYEIFEKKGWLRKL